MSAATAILMLMFLLVSANANPILVDVLQYDVIFTAKYVKTGSSAKFITQETLKGKIDKRVQDRVRIAARFAFKDNQMVLFKFWKNGSGEFGVDTLDSKPRVCFRERFQRNCVSTNEIADAVQKEASK